MIKIVRLIGMLLLTIFTAFLNLWTTAWAGKGDFTANVMMPLAIGDPANPHDPKYAQAWADNFANLKKMKAAGATGAYVDVWWGVVEPEEGQYRWAYYDKLFQQIIDADLEIAAQFSFHQCGGNVGDNVTILLPKYIWKKYIGEPGVEDENSLKYKSEQGNFSQEVISPWGMKYAAKDQSRVIHKFLEHFGPYSKHFSELNRSLGPAGELRAPSYNSHDVNAGYPGRGSLQAYSKMAVSDFHEFLFKKYGNLDGIKAAWGEHFAFLENVEQIFPPTNNGPGSGAGAFFDRAEQMTPYGIDVLDWYHQSHVQHGWKGMKDLIASVMGTPFSKVDVGFKIPGIHWMASGSRYAEMAAGLLPGGVDMSSDVNGHGYANMVKLAHDLGKIAGAPRVILHFTCLEMQDPNAKALVDWVAKEAKTQGVIIKGENAIADNLYKPESWATMTDAVRSDGYQGITLLRASDIVWNDVALGEFIKMAHEFVPGCTSEYSGNVTAFH